MKKIYLATPYTGTPEQEEERFQEACDIAGQLIRQGAHVFSPIAHSHPIATRSKLPIDHGFWIDFNRSWLEWADEVYVAKMRGWEQSRGVQWEVLYAREAGKPVKFLEVA
jgi:hypothetical protein